MVFHGTQERRLNNESGKSKPLTIRLDMGVNNYDLTVVGIL